MSKDRFDVLDRFAPLFESPQPSFELFLRRVERRQRKRRITGVVVGFAVLVALVVGLAIMLPFDRTQTPADSPASPALVVSVWSHPLAGGGNVHVRVYADGRFLRARGSPDSWMEQRLTTEGVELLRAEIISTGMFDPDHPVPDSGEYPERYSAPSTTRGAVNVLNGDTMVGVHCCWGLGLDWLGPFDRLIDRLRVPELWLPRSAWVNREERRRAPSRYAVCLESPDMVPQPLEPSPLLTSLPVPAQALLDGARPWIGAVDPMAQHCFDVDSHDAHEFIEAVGALARRDGWGLELDAGSDVGTVYISTVPYLPDGELGWTPG